MTRPIVCRCKHPVHFEGGRSVQDRLDIDPTHPYGNPCTHVVRAWDDSGLLVCAACDKIGHASRSVAVRSAALKANHKAQS